MQQIDVVHHVVSTVPNVLTPVGMRMAKVSGLAADSVDLWLSLTGTCTDATTDINDVVDYPCGQVISIDPSLSTMKILQGPSAGRVSLQAAGSLVSAGDYLYGKVYGTTPRVDPVTHNTHYEPLNGVGRWNKASGQLDLLMSPTGAPLWVDGDGQLKISSIDVYGDELIVNSASAHRIIQLKKASSGQPWFLTLKQSPGTDGNVNLDAETNYDVSLDGYSILIFDAETGSLLGSCSTGESCITQGPSPDHSYVAYVSRAATVAPPNDIRAEAIPDGRTSDRHRIPVTQDELNALAPDGDPKDVTFHQTGDAYRDAIFGFALLGFNAAHAKAVNLRIADVRAAHPAALISADPGNFRADLDPGNAYPTPSVPGYGRPDLVAEDAGVKHMWEVKYDSAFGRLTGPVQLQKYINGSIANGDPAVVGDTFLTTPSGVINSGTQSWLNGLTVEVHSSATDPGLELYTISGGRDRLFALVTARLVAMKLTAQAALDGQLTEVPAANGGFSIVLGGSVILTFVPAEVVVVPVPVP